MTSPILITGGTGNLGRHVTPLLRSAGHELRVLSRREHEPRDGIEYVTGDLLADRGIESAVKGAEIILHLAGGPKGDDVATRNLVRAAAHGDVRHIVLISVIGADRMSLGYFRAKLGAERVLAGSGLPWTTLRAAQFHDLVLLVASKLAALPVVPVPSNVRLEPVDVRDVAERLVGLTLGPPAGLVPDLAGPRIYPAAELLRGYLRASGRRRPILPVRLPGKLGRAYRAGENLSRDGGLVGRRTWEEYLAERVG